MTHGKFIFILNQYGDCLVTPDFNGNMYIGAKNSSEAIELLKRCKNVGDFEKISLKFVKDYGIDKNYDDSELENCEFLRRENIVTTNFVFDVDSNGMKDYIKNWFVDFLYVLNLCGYDIETKVCGEDGKDADWIFMSGTLTILDFGSLHSTIPCATETIEDYEKSKTDSYEMTPAKVCEILLEFNEWRRGAGDYEFNEDPTKNKDCPYSPAEIGKAIDTAIKFLKAY